MKNIIINSKVEYMEKKSAPDIPLFLFSYTIEIKNKTGIPIKLLNRHWEITDGNGSTNIVNGKGVIGLQPIILHEESFEYTSFCPLPTPMGFMEGTFRMVHSNGDEFDAQIKPFRLIAPQVLN